METRYGDSVYSEDLSWIALDIEPYRVDVIEIGGIQYEASYYGKRDIIGLRDYSYREYWRLENAYDDFKDMPLNSDVLPYDNYPMLINDHQVFVIDYYFIDGSVERRYYRSDGNMWRFRQTTEEFLIS